MIFMIKPDTELLWFASNPSQIFNKEPRKISRHYKWTQTNQKNLQCFQRKSIDIDLDSNPPQRECSQMPVNPKVHTEHGEKPTNSTLAKYLVIKTTIWTHNYMINVFKKTQMITIFRLPFAACFLCSPLFSPTH